MGCHLLFNFDHMNKYIEGSYEINLLDGRVVKLGKLTKVEAKVLFKLAEKLNGEVWESVGLVS